MGFDRDRLPDLPTYADREGLTLTGPLSAKWKTGPCVRHGGSDSLRVNVQTGGGRCMACDFSFGDVLSYHMQTHGLEFIEAARQLGAWIEDGKPVPHQKPAPLPARAALQVLAFEANLAAVAAGNVAHGVKLTDQDRFRLLTAASRINRIAEAYQ
jgi:hypothetical protein